MEFLNRLEIVGIVGNTTTNKVGDLHITRLSVVVEYGYKAEDGTNVIDTQWFNVTAWEKEGTKNAPSLKRGDWVRVRGRVRQYRFTNADGTSVGGFEVVARSVERINQDADHLEPQKD